MTSEAEKMLALKEEKIQGQTGTSQLVRGGFLGKTVCQTLYHSGRKQVQDPGNRDKLAVHPSASAALSALC